MANEAVWVDKAGRKVWRRSVAERLNKAQAAKAAKEGGASSSKEPEFDALPVINPEQPGIVQKHKKEGETDGQLACDSCDKGTTNLGVQRMRWKSPSTRNTSRCMLKTKWPSSKYDLHMS